MAIETTALAVLSESYPVLGQDMKQVQAKIHSTLGGEQLTPRDLDTITVPSGGGVHWSIPDILEGETSEKELTGIIIGIQQGRKYWQRNLEDGDSGTPPDCYSTDGITGRGDPGGVCSQCPLDKYETASKGKGKACKEYRSVFLLRPGDSFLPVVLTVPASSLKPFTQFRVRLAGVGMELTDVVSKFTLKKIAGSGPAYSQIVFGVAEKLDAEAAAKAKAYADSMKPSFERAHQTTAAHSDHEDEVFGGQDAPPPDFGADEVIYDPDA